MTVAHDDLGVALLEALCAEWMKGATPDEIGSELPKIRLLKEAARVFDLSSRQISPELASLYQGVFLRSIEEVAASA